MAEYTNKAIEKYEEALNALRNGFSWQDYEKAAELFGKAGNYLDAAEKKTACLAEAKKIKTAETEKTNKIRQAKRKKFLTRLGIAAAAIAVIIICGISLRNLKYDINSAVNYLERRDTASTFTSMEWGRDNYEKVCKNVLFRKRLIREMNSLSSSGDYEELSRVIKNLDDLQYNNEKVVETANGLIGQYWAETAESGNLDEIGGFMANTEVLKDMASFENRDDIASAEELHELYAEIGKAALETGSIREICIDMQDMINQGIYSRGILVDDIFPADRILSLALKGAEPFIFRNGEGGYYDYHAAKGGCYGDICTSSGNLLYKGEKTSVSSNFLSNFFGLSDTLKPAESSDSETVAYAVQDGDFGEINTMLINTEDDYLCGLTEKSILISGSCHPDAVFRYSEKLNLKGYSFETEKSKSVGESDAVIAVMSTIQDSISGAKSYLADNINADSGVNTLTLYIYVTDPLLSLTNEDFAAMLSKTDSNYAGTTVYGNDIYEVTAAAPFTERELTAMKARGATDADIAKWTALAVENSSSVAGDAVSDTADTGLSAANVCRSYASTPASVLQLYAADLDSITNQLAQAAVDEGYDIYSETDGWLIYQDRAISVTKLMRDYR